MKGWGEGRFPWVTDSFESLSVCFFRQVRKKRKVRNIIYKVDLEKCSECEGEEDRTEDIKENVAQRELTIYTSAVGKNT